MTATKIIYAESVGLDFARILARLNQYFLADADERIGDIFMSIDVLQHSPKIGRLVGNSLRQLVIGRDARGYVAL